MSDPTSFDWTRGRGIRVIQASAYGHAQEELPQVPSTPVMIDRTGSMVEIAWRAPAQVVRRFATAQPWRGSRERRAVGQTQHDQLVAALP